MGHVYIGLRARGRGFAELWSLEPAIENIEESEYLIEIQKFFVPFSLLIPKF